MLNNQKRFFVEPRQAPKRRPIRVAEIIRNELLGLLRLAINDPRLHGVVVTEVQMSDDLRTAKVFYDVSDEGVADAAAGFEKAKGFIRHHLAGVLDMRYCPELVFRRDLKIIKQAAMEKLLREIADEQQ